MANSQDLPQTSRLSNAAYGALIAGIIAGATMGVAGAMQFMPPAPAPAKSACELQLPHADGIGALILLDEASRRAPASRA